MAEDGLLSSAIRVSADAFAVFRRDESERFVLELANAQGERWFGGGPDARLRAALTAVLAGPELGGPPVRHQIERAAGPDDDAAVLEVIVTRLDQDRVVLAGRDITELANGRRLLESAYEQTAQVRAVLQTALDATSEAFAVYDVVRDHDAQVSALTLVLINVAGATQLGVEDPEDLTGGQLEDFLPQVRTSGMWQAVLDTLHAQVTQTFRLHEYDDQGVWFAAWDNTIAPVGEERVVITWREVTDDERRERLLGRARDLAQHASTHDALTGLANRRLLHEALTEALLHSDDQQRVGLVYVDLDRFKQVNDTMGHATGDALLRAVAARLSRVARGDDLAARLGGDEFVLLLRRLPPDWDPSAFLARCRSAIERPLALPGAVLHPQVSLGLVTSSPTVREPEALMRLADSTMYGDKQARHRPVR